MLVDHINKNGFVYRNAYPFSKPAQVRICLLPYRFLVFGPIRLLLSLVAWLFFGGIFVIILGTIIVFVVFLLGEKFVDYRHGPLRQSFIVGGNFLDRLIVLNYRTVPINRLSILVSRGILPWHILAAISVPLALWYIMSAIVGAIAVGAHDLWSWIAFMTTEFMEMRLWIPALLFTILVVTGLVAYGIQELRKSEAYGLLKMFVQAKVDKICPIIPVK